MFRHVVKRLCEAIVVVSIGVGAIAPCAASPAPVIQRDSLNPATYHSPSKTYVLQVDPSNPDGSGKGTYTVVRDGKQVWKGERDFALWHAAISDSGIVVGCAYTQGLGAFGNSVDGSNDLLAVVMDAAGQVVMRDARPRSYAGVDSNPPSPDAPTCMGIVLDEPNDLFLVRLKGAWRVREEKWATYSIKDAKLIREFVPEQPVSGERAFHRAHLCEIVPGTPLILMQWYTWKMTSDTPPFIVTHGARVSLLTSEGKEVWNFDIPGEYDGLGERWSD